MNITAGGAKERRIKEVKAAISDSKEFKKYINLFLYGKSKTYIVTYLQHVISELREIHDQYYR